VDSGINPKSREARLTDSFFLHQPGSSTFGANLITIGQRTLVFDTGGGFGSTRSHRQHLTPSSQPSIETFKRGRARLTLRASNVRRCATFQVIGATTYGRWRCFRIAFCPPIPRGWFHHGPTAFDFRHHLGVVLGAAGVGDHPTNLVSSVGGGNLTLTWPATHRFGRCKRRQTTAASALFPRGVGGVGWGGGGGANACFDVTVSNSPQIRSAGRSARPAPTVVLNLLRRPSLTHDFGSRAF